MKRGYVVAWIANIAVMLTAVSAFPRAQQAPPDPRLSDVESVRCLATFTNALIVLHGKQQKYDQLSADDFVQRMTGLRLMSTEADVQIRSMSACARSSEDKVRDPAEAAVTVFKGLKTTFDANVALYEDIVRIFTVPHVLTEAETKTIAEGRIKASKLAASSAESADLLRLASTLAFASVVVEAPGDPQHIALNMTSRERDSFRRNLREAFGDLEKTTRLVGMEQAAFVLAHTFSQDWRLAK